MSKYLFLQRHAEPQPSGNIRDTERNLSDFGIEQSIFLGKFLEGHIIKPEKILCSPANRTKQTLEIISKQLSKNIETHIEHKIYCASTEDLKTIISSQDDSLRSVMLIGHNPSITDIFNHMRIEASPELSKALDYEATGKLVIIEISSDSWGIAFQSDAKILSAISP